MSKPSRSSAGTLYEHVRELQFRVLASVSVLLVGGVLGYFLYNPLFQLLRSPLHTPLYYSSPAGSFIFVMKICLLVAIAVALPVIIYNIIMFIRPAFASKLSKKRVYMTTIGSVILAAIGATFAFTVILPASIKFFVGFQVTGLNALLDASSYLAFVTNILISFMIVFQLPLIISLIDHIKPIPPKKLLKFEKWVVISGLIIGVIAPFSFDPTTELLIAAPIIILFNLSIVMIVLQHAHRRSVAKRAIKRQARNTQPATEELSAAIFADLVSTLPAVTSPHQDELQPVATTPEKLPSSSALTTSFVAMQEALSINPPLTAKVRAPGQKWMDVAPRRPIGQRPALDRSSVQIAQSHRNSPYNGSTTPKTPESA